MDEGLAKILKAGEEMEAADKKLNQELLEILGNLGSELNAMEIQSDKTTTLIDDIKAKIREIQRLIAEQARLHG